MARLVFRQPQSIAQRRGRDPRWRSCVGTCLGIVVVGTSAMQIFCFCYGISHQLDVRNMSITFVLGPQSRNNDEVQFRQSVLPRGKHSLATRCASAAYVEPASKPLFSTAKKGSGGGQGGGPSDLQKLQVLVYRLAFFASATAYLAAFVLDFLGGNLIGWSVITPDTAGAAALDSQVADYAKTALRLGDLAIGVAALAVPMGSLVAGRVLLWLLGFLTVAVAALGASAPGMPGALIGPVCVGLILAREIYWFGLDFKVDAALGLLLFSGIVAIRISDVMMPSNSIGAQVPERLATEEDLVYGIAAATETTALGPPLPLSALSSSMLLLSSFGKLFESIGEDIDEEGNQWQKRSSTMRSASRREDRDSEDDQR